MLTFLISSVKTIDHFTRIKRLKTYHVSTMSVQWTDNFCYPSRQYCQDMSRILSCVCDNPQLTPTRPLTDHRVHKAERWVWSTGDGRRLPVDSTWPRPSSSLLSVDSKDHDWIKSRLKVVKGLVDVMAIGLVVASFVTWTKLHTLSPASTGLGDWLWVSTPFEYVTKPTRSTQLCIPVVSQSLIEYELYM